MPTVLTDIAAICVAKTWREVQYDWTGEGKMITYIRGSSSVTMTVEFRNRLTKALVDPATSITCTVVDPKNTIVVSAAAATQDSTGKYYYIYTPGSTANLGVYKYWFVGTEATGAKSIRAREGDLPYGEFKLITVGSTST